VRYLLLVVYSAMGVEAGLEAEGAAHFVVVVPQLLVLVHMENCMNWQNSQLGEPTY